MPENIERLKKVAVGLGPLKDRIVFVGGCVAELYASNPAFTEVRPTEDVDCVVNLSSYSDYNAFCDLLREQSFVNSRRPGDPICRWSFQDELVDIMPFEESPLGPSNKWYKPGMERKIIYEISKGLTIQLLPVTYYVATKLEAIESRGGDDLRFSHDFEDLIYVLNYSDVFEHLLLMSDDISLLDYFKEKFRLLLSRPYIQEEVQSALPYDERDRTTLLLEMLQRIAETV